MSNEIIVGDTLDVRFEDQLVGQIERKSANILEITFRYARDWLESHAPFPISLTMPLGRDEFSPQVTYPWFMNLLPEGRALQILGALLKTAELDVFAMLEEMGGDLPGALKIRRAGATAAQHQPGIRPLSEHELADCIRALPERPVLAGSEGITMSLAGVQDKLPVIRLKTGQLALPTYGMASTHILKPMNKKFRDSVQNEAYCLILAKAVGLRSVPVAIGRAEEFDYLLVQRYDRKIDGKAIRRTHQEDFCQALGFPPYLKYEWNREVGRHGPSASDCMKVLASAPNSAINRMRFLDAMLFSILVGNSDAHSKNYSLLLGPEGIVEMAPTYDVLCSDIYPNVTKNLAMKIAGKQRGGHLHGRHWDGFAEETGLSATQVRHRVAELSQKVLEAAPEIAIQMGEKYGRPEPYREISGYVTNYCRRMLVNLRTEPPMEQEAEADIHTIS